MGFNARTWVQTPQCLYHRTILTPTTEAEYRPSVSDNFFSLQKILILFRIWNWFSRLLFLFIWYILNIFYASVYASHDFFYRISVVQVLDFQINLNQNMALTTLWTVIWLSSDKKRNLLIRFTVLLSIQKYLKPFVKMKLLLWLTEYVSSLESLINELGLDKLSIIVQVHHKPCSTPSFRFLDTHYLIRHVIEIILFFFWFIQYFVGLLWSSYCKIC